MGSAVTVKDPPRRSLVVIGVGLLLVLAVTYLLTRLSLDNVAGATRRRNGSCCNTSFVNDNWWAALAVLAVPICWLAWKSWWAGLVALAIPTYASFHIATVTIHRYLVTGWGDGLEVLSYIGTGMHLVIFSVAEGLGVLVAARRRRRRRRELAAVG